MGKDSVKDKTKSNDGQLKDIELALIETKGQSVRHEDDYDHIVELANSILTAGLLQPIVVAKNGKGFELIAGKHRIEACRRLGWKKIRANIVEKSKEYSRRGFAMIENVLRKSMSIEEETNVVELLHDEEKKSIGQICGITGKGRAWVQSRLLASNLNPKVKERLFANDINISIAEELAKIEDESIQNEVMWQAIQCRLTLSQVRDLAKLYLDAPSIQDAVARGQESLSKVLETKTPQRKCDSCGCEKTYGELVNIFVCKEGCNHANLDNGILEEDFYNG